MKKNRKNVISVERMHSGLRIRIETVREIVRRGRTSLLWIELGLVAEAFLAYIQLGKIRISWLQGLLCTKGVIALYRILEVIVLGLGMGRVGVRLWVGAKFVVMVWMHHGIRMARLVPSLLVIAWVMLVAMLAANRDRMVSVVGRKTPPRLLLGLAFGQVAVSTRRAKDAPIDRRFNAVTPAFVIKAFIRLLNRSFLNSLPVTSAAGSVLLRLLFPKLFDFDLILGSLDLST